MIKKFFILLLFTQLSFSQTIKGVVLDSISKKPLELVNVFFEESYYGTFTNSKGEFVLSTKKNTNDLFITNIGYESKKIKISVLQKKMDSLTFFYLKPRLEALDEIVLTDKKIKYSASKKILSEREKVLTYAFQFGSENVTYVKNVFYKRGKIESLKLDLKKIKNYPKQCRKCKVDYIASINVKFYEYDKRNKLPGKELYYKNIIVDLENKTYSLKIDVDSLNIDFPKDGVCVGVETINTKYEKPKISFAIIAPSIKFTNTKRKEEVLSWSRYRNEGWIFKTSSNKKRKNLFFKSLIVDLKVKIEK
jgi:hypothetical protein